MKKDGKREKIRKEIRKKTQKIIAALMVLFLLVSTAAGITASAAVEQGDGFVRIHGESRIITAIEVSRAGWPTGSANVVLASGRNFPDALTGGPLAAMLDAPILLTGGESLELAVNLRLAEMYAQNVYILGGTASVSESIEQQLRGYGLKVERLAGDDRYETSAAIAEKMDRLRGKAPDTIFVADSAGFADAISVTPVAALMKSPIIITPSSSPGFAAASQNYAAGCGTKNAVIIGGTNAVKPDIETKLAALGFSFKRIAGNNRYATSAQIYANYKHLFPGGNALMTTGLDFPDALSGGALGAKFKAPLFLVNGANHNLFSADIRGALANLRPAATYVIGGPGAVTNAVVDVHKYVSTVPAGNRSLPIANLNHMLPATFVPPLVPVGKKAPTTGDYYLTQETLDAYVRMYQDLVVAGKGNVYIISAYRSYQRQNELLNNRINSYISSGYSPANARAQALKSIQAPGASEHQLGLSIDLSTNGSTQSNFHNLSQGRWITENCPKYGFVIRYAANKQSITGIIHEPWHLRYVGVEHAQYMTANGLCLEEYILL
ncbi:MAG: cell wall-binding repeat-containing protein [Oscillospiraceae bacterium]|nr:cell wall-binding repeat-containing protein [Oscillospiraceae bacterium]